MRYTNPRTHSLTPLVKYRNARVCVSRCLSVSERISEKRVAVFSSGSIAMRQIYTHTVQIQN